MSIASAPLSEQDVGSCKSDLGQSRSGIFFAEALDKASRGRRFDLPVGRRARISPHQIAAWMPTLRRTRRAGTAFQIMWRLWLTVWNIRLDDRQRRSLENERWKITQQDRFLSPKLGPLPFGTQARKSASLNRSNFDVCKRTVSFDIFVKNWSAV